jgi:hypothetical protein
VLLAYCLFLFRFEYKAAQAVADTASSKIASAAQGYVEIIGHGASNKALRAPYSSTPCLWYSATMHETNGWISRLLLRLDRSDWKLLESSASTLPFTLTDDGAAQCVVNPTGAQVSALDYTEWFSGKYFYREALLLTNKPVHVVGNFATQADINTLSKPRDGRPFIISHHSQRALITAHKRHSGFYALMALLFIGLLATPNIKLKNAGETTYPQGWPLLQVASSVSCPDLIGSYATQSTASAINQTPVSPAIALSDTFIGYRIAAAETAPVAFQEGDSINFAHTDNLNNWLLTLTHAGTPHAYLFTQYTGTGVDIPCANGWVISHRKTANNRAHSWVYVAMAKDEAGNLIAKEYYSEPTGYNRLLRRSFNQEDVIKWTRWPRLDQ